MNEQTFFNTLSRIAHAVAELPGFRFVAEPLYRRQFLRFRREANACCGVFTTYSEASALAQSHSAASTYDIDAAAQLYQDRLERVLVSDYPSIYWLSRLFSGGARTVFDLGGHIGISYYGFRKHIDYPAGLRWLVHDLPTMITAGRTHARVHDIKRQLAFCESTDEASGCDVLFSSGALQYLAYTLPELLQRLDSPPPNIVVNLVPMHPERSFFTLQNIRIAICPYRVTAVPEFIEELEDMGYTLVDHWRSYERSLRIPFRHRYDVDSYHGFYFKRIARADDATAKKSFGPC